MRHKCCELCGIHYLWTQVGGDFVSETEQGVDELGLASNPGLTLDAPAPLASLNA